MKDPIIFLKGTPTANDVVLFQDRDQPEIKTFIPKGHKFTITGIVEKVTRPPYDRSRMITVKRAKENREHFNEFFKLYLTDKQTCNVVHGMTVKVSCQENSEKYEGRDSLWVCVYADILAIYCPYKVVDVQPPFVNKWRESMDFSNVITSEEYPGDETNSSWIPIINYNRVKIVDTKIVVSPYKQGSEAWRERANLELQRFGEKLLKGTERGFTL